MDDSEEKETTTTRENKGTIRRSVSLNAFPAYLYQSTMDRTGNGVTVGDIFSDAIQDMKADYDTGEAIILIKCPNDGVRKNIWIRLSADHDMRHLADKLAGDFTSVIYTSMVRFFEKERNRPGAFKSDI